MRKGNQKLQYKMGIIILLLFFSGCKASQGEGEEPKVLVLATFDDSPYLRKQIEIYHGLQDAYRIEVEKYERSEQKEKDGILRLQREIVAGQGPDIIDYGTLYTTSDVVGEYTINLFDYMGKNWKEEYVENIVHSFLYKEKLYALPMGFSLSSFVGTKENLGKENSWTIEEMMEC